MKRNPRVGWIPANQAGDPATTQEILELTKKVRTLEQDLRRVRGRQSLDVSDLADGEESIDLEIAFDVSAPTNKNYPRSEVVARYSDKTAVTWNDLFRAAAPRIAPVASDTSIRSAINGLLEHRLKPPPRTVGKDQWVSSVWITEGSYNIIKVQFIALGLVTIGKEKLDTGKLSTIQWRLTELGETRMQQTLAVRTRLKKSSAVSATSSKAA